MDTWLLRKFVSELSQNKLWMKTNNIVLLQWITRWFFECCQQRMLECSRNIIFLISLLAGVIYIGKALRHPKIILNGFEYLIHIKKGNRTRWRCKERYTKCKAILYTSGNTVSVQHDHNHPNRNVNYTHLGIHKVNITREKIKLSVLNE